MPPLPQIWLSTLLAAAGAFFSEKEALLSYKAVISETANTSQEMIVVSQRNDIDSPVLLYIYMYVQSGPLLLSLAVDFARYLSDDLLFTQQTGEQLTF